MKILVVGASQGTGALCVKSALAKGHSVSAFSRTPAKLDLTHPALTKVAGDFHDAASVRSAVAGHDAVIVCASPSSLGTIKDKPDYFSRGTKYCIEAMKEQGVRRLVVLTRRVLGCSPDERDHAPANLPRGTVADTHTETPEPPSPSTSRFTVAT